MTGPRAGVTVLSGLYPVDWALVPQGAVDAARTVSMPTDAYGIICQPFRMMLDPVEQWGLDALQGAVEAMEAAGESVRNTVAQYREMEDAVRDSFGSAG
ncbi:hypothetical protein K7G98_31835 [Saccharothrix sp. MB29]|nr:hypothetical protein [Saccharothrix sp. MB29]